MKKFNEAYARILMSLNEKKLVTEQFGLDEPSQKNCVTVTMLDDQSYTPTEEEDQRVVDDCIKNHVAYERENGSWKFWTDTFYVDNLKKVLMNNWRVGEGLDAALEGIEQAFDKAVDLDGNEMSFSQFFADEIQRSGYEPEEH